MGGTAAASTARGVRHPRGLRVAAGARTVVWTAAAAVLLQTAIGAANEFTLESSFLNPDEEGSLSQLATAAVTAVAGTAAAAHAILFPARRRRFAALGVILLYFAVDDVLVLHEGLGEAVGERLFGLSGHLAVRLWILLLAPLLAAAFLLVASEARRAGGRLRTVLFGGLGALVAAVVVEVGGAVTRSPSFIDRVSGKPETLRYLLEEALELGGWILLAGGLLVLLSARADGEVGAYDRRS
jgi:hypothetical protein